MWICKKMQTCFKLEQETATTFSQKNSVIIKIMSDFLNGDSFNTENLTRSKIIDVWSYKGHISTTVYCQKMGGLFTGGILCFMPELRRF